METFSERARWRLARDSYRGLHGFLNVKSNPLKYGKYATPPSMGGVYALGGGVGPYSPRDFLPEA